MQNLSSVTNRPTGVEFNAGGVVDFDVRGAGRVEIVILRRAVRISAGISFLTSKNDTIIRPSYLIATLLNDPTSLSLTLAYVIVGGLALCFRLCD